MPKQDKPKNGNRRQSTYYQRLTQSEREGIRASEEEDEGFGRTNSQRGEMDDLNFDVVKHNEEVARRVAERIHLKPPVDEDIALFTDASLPGEQGQPGEGQTTPWMKARPFFLEVVTHQLFSLGNRPSDCLISLPLLQVEELELLAILRGFEYAVVEVEVRMLADLTTRRLLLWSDCLGGLNKLRLYRAGDSEYWKAYPHTWILRLILECARKLKEYGVYVKCHWSRAHSRIPANEAADYVAKQAKSDQPWNPVELAYIGQPWNPVELAYYFGLAANVQPVSS
ncbi:hypothetical protein UCDDS831_g07747 [Diplodia seriata]|uniref:RNase H type-1 domain-containing protein n=1 Tax=Diplodia seriata TaxID=420778 RepID=A0A0G2DYK2_9PEZI|nr:hypothetical protein UCDDS831_g07747 [Diplodia seriata]